MRNTLLYATTKKFTQNAISYLREKFADDYQKALRHCIVNMCENLRGFDYYKEVKNALLSENILARHIDKMVGWPGTLQSFRAEQLLGFIIEKAIGQQAKIEINTASFNKIYLQIEEYLYSDQVEITSYAQLTWVKNKQNKERFSLTKTITIEKLITEPGDAMYPSRQEFTYGDWYIKCKFKAPKCIGGGAAKPNPRETASEIFSDVCSSLRLAKQQDIGFGDIWIESNQPSVLGRTGIINPLRKPRNFYEIDEKCLNKARQIYHDLIMLKAGNSSNKLSILNGIKRFNFAQDRFNNEDKIIDYCTSLESLLLTEGERQELTLTIASRGACFARQLRLASKDTYSLLRDAYKKRSKVVHGSNNLVGHDLITKIDDYVRRLLVKSLKNPEQFSKNKLEEIIINTISR